MIAKEIGAEIAKNRKAKQLKIADISEQTRISREYLDKIEQGDFAFLPKPYVTAYIKTFARHVGLDGESLVQKWQRAEAAAKAAAEAESVQIDSEEKPAEPRPAQRSPARDSSAKRDGGTHLKEFGIGAAVIAALALVFYFASQPAEQTMPENKASEPVANELSIQNMIAENEARIDSIASQISMPAATKPAAVAAEQPFTLRLEASDTVWIKLVVDGVDSSEYMFRPGNSRAWQANNFFYLRTGNAGATHIFRNGVALDSLGRAGQVRQLRITRNEIR